MNFKATVNDFSTEINALEERITFSFHGKEENICYEDIICIEKTDQDGQEFKLHFIRDHPFPNYKLTKEEYRIKTEDAIFDEFEGKIKSKIEEARRPKKVVIFINPVGGQGKGQQTCTDVVEPTLMLAGIQSEIVVSEKAGHAKEFAESYDFKSVDGMVIMGGDGTISEILNVLMRKTQQDAGVDINDPEACLKTLDFPISVIPTGTGNGLSNIAYGCKDPLTSTLYIIRGKTSKLNLLGCFNENKLVHMSIICTFYGMVNDLGSQESPLKNSRFFLIRLLALTVVPLWHFFWKPLREMNVDLTYEYLKGEEPDTLSDEEKASATATVSKRITSVLCMAYDMELDTSKSEQQYKDQFDILSYTTCGKLRLLKHLVNVRHLTKEHLESVKDFVEPIKLTGYRIKVKEDDDPVHHQLNLNFSIDGEMHKIKTPDIYTKLFPRCFTMYTSYNGPRKFW